MAYQADNIFVEQYNSRLRHAYQPQGFLLQGMFMPEGRIEGKKAYWPRYGKRTAAKKVRGVRATPDNPDMDHVAADLETWETFNYIHQFDLSRLKANEREAAVQAGAMALGRAVDAEAISKMGAAAPTSGVGFIDTSAGQLTPAQLMVLLGLWMGGKDIPADGQIFGAIPMIAHQQLMADKVYANSQWIGPDLPFKSRTTGRHWNFVNWVILPDSYFPIPAANQWDAFIWHRPNVGWSNNKGTVGDGANAQESVQTWWVWDNELGAWSVRQEAEGAGVVIRNEAVARLRLKSNVAAITIA